MTPGSYTFTAADKGVKGFSVQFLTLPVTLPLTVTVTDTGPLPRFRQLQVLLQTGPFVAAGTGAGTEAVARMFSTATNAETMAVKPFAAGFLGGVRVAVADFNNDGVPDLAAAAGPGGGPHVRLFDGVTGEQMAGPLGSFFGFEASFDGGVQVAAGDIDGDGVADLILAAGPGGGPRVRVFSGLSGAVLRDFFAYAPDFRGGLSVAVGDVNGDGKSDIVTGAGAGGGPQVRAFDGSAAAPQDAALASFFAYAPDFFGGVSVAVGDTDGDGFAEILTGAGLGGGPQVNVFDARTGAARRSFHAFDPGFLGGVNVSAVDVDRDGNADVVAGAGVGGGPRVRSFDAVTLAEKNDLLAFDPALRNGVHVGGRAKTTA